MTEQNQPSTQEDFATLQMNRIKFCLEVLALEYQVRHQIIKDINAGLINSSNPEALIDAQNQILDDVDTKTKQLEQEVNGILKLSQSTP